MFLSSQVTERWFHVQLGLRLGIDLPNLGLGITVYQNERGREQVAPWVKYMLVGWKC